MTNTRDTITIPFPDAKCVAIISTWLSGTAGRVWCSYAEQSDAQASRWHLTLNDEGIVAYNEGDSMVPPYDPVRVDIIPHLIREAIGALIAAGTRGEKEIAARALVEDGAIDCYQADVIVQKAILGRVVYG